MLRSVFMDTQSFLDLSIMSIFLKIFEYFKANKWCFFVINLVGNARSRAWAYYTWSLIRNHYTWCRKKSIERPKRIHFFSTHNAWNTYHNTMIKAYFDRKISTFSEYVFIFVLLCLCQNFLKFVDFYTKMYRIKFWIDYWKFNMCNIIFIYKLKFTHDASL